MFTIRRSYGLFVIMLFACTAIAADLHALPNTAEVKQNLLGLNSISKMKPNGTFEVQVLKGGKWQEAGSLSYDRFFREKAIDLGAYTPVRTQKAEGSRQEVEMVRLKLIQKGGGGAHIDSVLLGGRPAQEITGLQGTTALKKLSRKDYDVVNALGKSLELTFPVSGEDKTLRLVARVEGTTISKTPFQFPRENLYRPMDLQSRFYGYQFNAEKGSLKIDGDLNEVVSNEPFFKEYSRTGSGHPSGFTYGWVRNDDEYLYAAVDFTPDNTMDGDKDYAKIFAKTGDGLKEFKVSMPERSWGSPGFTYTDKVAYQHKVYEFKIPLRELGITNHAANPLSPPFDKGGLGGFTGGVESQEIQLAFAAYGTAGPGDSYPELAYDPTNNRFLLVYTNVDIDQTYYHLVGQLLNSDGTTNGAPFPICNHAGSYPWDYSVAYDSVNQRFLVAWTDYRNGNNDIYGQLVNADGSLYGTDSDVNFVISNPGNNQYSPSVDYDSIDQRFLVTFNDYRNGNSDVYGQLVNADGSLFGTTSDINFVISNAANYQGNPVVAYDSTNQRFLVAWQDSRNGGSDIYGQLVNADGSLFDTASNVNFAISNGPDGQYEPSVAYDSVNQRFLVAWQDWRNLINYDIFGQLVNADGYLYGTASDANFVISNAGNSQEHSLAAYDSVNQRFLVAWRDGRNGNIDIYGQLVNSSGTLFKTVSDINFPIYEDPYNQYIFSLASNSRCRNFLVSYDFPGAGVSDIGTALVGYPCVSSIKVHSPNGGEILTPASSHLIEWAAPARGVKFKIKYSLDKGLTWKPISCTECHPGGPDGPITTTDHEWIVPKVANNKKNCLVKVIGYNAKNVVVSADKSDAPFKIEVVRLGQPNGGESLLSNFPFQVQWTTNETIRDVGSVSILYTLDGGVTWKKAGDEIGNDGTYEWTPSVTKQKTKCKVKVVLKDADGKVVGSDASDGYFKIIIP